MHPVFHSELIFSFDANEIEVKDDFWLEFN